MGSGLGVRVRVKFVARVGVGEAGTDYKEAWIPIKVLEIMEWQRNI